MSAQKETTFLESLTRPAFGIVSSQCEVRVSPPQPIPSWRIPYHGTDCFDVVVRETAKAFRVTPEQILSRARTERVAWARQIAIAIYAERSSEGPREVGRRFGRDRANVSYAILSVKERASLYPQLAAALQDLDGKITAALQEAK